MAHHRTGGPIFRVLEHGSLGGSDDTAAHHHHHHHDDASKDKEQRRSREIPASGAAPEGSHEGHSKDKGEQRDAEAPHAAAAAARPSLAAPARSPATAAVAPSANVPPVEVGIEMPGMPAKLGPAGSPPLNLLANLPGEWHGTGFNLIFLPVFYPPHTKPKPKPEERFRVMLNTTHEILEFNPIPGAIPNRGDTQKDVDLFGMTYMQRINDAVNQEALHKEPGIWLVVPPTTVPEAAATVVRQGCVPHGNSFHAVGTAKSYAGPPKIPDADITPIIVPALGIPVLKDISIVQPSYMTPIHAARDENPTLPVMNPNLGLQRVIEKQNIIETVEIHVSTKNPGIHLQGNTITNIPFLQKHAEAVKMESTFYLETVKRKDGSVFLQLQYTQLVMLRFQEIDWPHISIATLVKS